MDKMSWTNRTVRLVIYRDGIGAQSSHENKHIHNSVLACKVHVLEGCKAA